MCSCVSKHGLRERSCLMMFHLLSMSFSGDRVNTNRTVSLRLVIGGVGAFSALLPVDAYIDIFMMIDSRR